MSEQENKIICAHIVGDAIISPAYLNIDSARFWRIEGGRPESVVVLRRRIDEGLTARDVCSVEFLETIMDLNKNMHYKQSQIELTMISQDFWAIKIHFKEKIQAMISYAHAGAYMAQKDKDFYRDFPCKSSIGKDDINVGVILKRVSYQKWQEYRVKDILLYVRMNREAKVSA